MQRGILIFLLVLSLKGTAQDKIISFEHVVPREDLSQNYFISLFRDIKGYLWLGTYSALYRYDGYKVTTFVPGNDNNTISNPVVNCAYQDNDSTIWFGTEGGINVYNLQTGKFIRLLSIFTKPAINDNNVKSICKDDEGNLWIATYGGGINVYNRKTRSVKIYKNDPADNASLSANRVNVIFSDRNNTIWIGTERGGLCRYDKKNDNFERFLSDKNKPNTISDNTINAICEDTKGRLWIGTWRGGLNLFDREKKQFRCFLNHEKYEGKTTGSTIRSIAEDADGNLWLGSFGSGLYYFNTSDYSYQSFHHDDRKVNSLTSDFIWSLLYDKTGILWIGTAGNGLNKYDANRHKFPTFMLSHYEKMPVMAIYEDNRNQIWIGSSKGTLERFNRSANTFTYYLKGKLYSDITSIVEDKIGNLWLGTSNEGLVKYNPADNTCIIYKEFNAVQTSLFITALFMDKSGNLWFGLYDNGLYKIDAAQLKKRNNTKYTFREFWNNPADINTISSNIIMAINEDSQDNIWVATDKFIDKIEKDKSYFKHYGGYSYSCIYQKNPGELWIGTYGKGVIRFSINKNTFEFFDKSKGLSHDLVNGITGDEDGNIWISTFNGISRYDPYHKKFINYDANDGLQGNQFLHNSCCRLSTGEIAFGGTDGFNILKPDSLKPSPLNIPVVISDIKLFNKSITYDTLKYNEAVGRYALSELPELKLKYSDKVFSIEFAALNFSTPERQLYAYKLEGFDKEWVTTDAQNRLATYTNLDDGTYTFKVKTINQDGTISLNETSFKIIVTPPFYETWQFRVFVLIAVIGIIYFFYRKRIQFLHEKYLKIQLQNEQELIKLKNEKLDAELGYKSKELTSRTMNLIHTNERIKEIYNQLNNLLPAANNEIKTRLQFILRSLDNEVEDDSYWDQFEYHFNETHDNFLKRFKDTYPILTHNDLKMCAYIRMNLQNQEIASLLNISIRSVETNRFRIRKKINLDSRASLSAFILRF